MCVSMCVWCLSLTHSTHPSIFTSVIFLWMIHCYAPDGLCEDGCSHFVLLMINPGIFSMCRPIIWTNHIVLCILSLLVCAITVAVILILSWRSCREEQHDLLYNCSDSAAAARRCSGCPTAPPSGYIMAFHPLNPALICYYILNCENLLYYNNCLK